MGLDLAPCDDTNTEGNEEARDLQHQRSQQAATDCFAKDKVYVEDNINNTMKTAARSVHSIPSA